ncbi:MAG: GNAT family N-acetyltransferase [Bacteroidota bacterium]
MEIIVIDQGSEFLDRGVEYFWRQWGEASNFDFYRNCIEHSIYNEAALPKFFLLLDNDKIIGSYALLTNDLISRQDLLPWLACLFVDKEYRNQGLAQKLLDHSMAESRKRGYQTLYLSTSLNNFYEKKGWEYFAMGYTAYGKDIKIYAKNCN